MREETKRKAVTAIGTVVLGLMFGHLLMAPLDAYAVSLPYVDDVSSGKKSSTATVVCAGGEKSFELRVYDRKTGKRVKVEHHKKRVWTVELKNGRTYRLKVRGVKKSGKKTAWKAIEYKVC